MKEFEHECLRMCLSIPVRSFIVSWGQQELSLFLRNKTKRGTCQLMSFIATFCIKPFTQSIRYTEPNWYKYCTPIDICRIQSWTTRHRVLSNLSMLTITSCQCAPWIEVASENWLVGGVPPTRHIIDVIRSCLLGDSIYITSIHRMDCLYAALLVCGLWELQPSSPHTHLFTPAPLQLTQCSGFC